MLAYFRTLFSDLLYWRVCVALFGTPFAGLGSYGCYSLLLGHPSEPLEWVGFALLVAVGLYGVSLVYASIFLTDAGFEKSIRYIHDGGEILGIVLILAVALVAVPVAIVIRRVKSNVQKP